MREHGATFAPAPECPRELAYVLAWFLDLAAGRGGNSLGGVAPLAHTEIAAWAALYGIAPTPYELELLRRLDLALLLTVKPRA